MSCRERLLTPSHLHQTLSDGSLVLQGQLLHFLKIWVYRVYLILCPAGKSLLYCYYYYLHILLSIYIERHSLTSIGIWHKPSPLYHLITACHIRLEHWNTFKPKTLDHTKPIWTNIQFLWASSNRSASSSSAATWTPLPFYAKCLHRWRIRWLTHYFLVHSWRFISLPLSLSLSLLLYCFWSFLNYVCWGREMRPWHLKWIIYKA